MSDFELEKTLISNTINIPPDLLEFGLDSIIKDDLLKDIPVFSTLIGLAKAGLNIRDRLFIKKLMYFLFETQHIPKEKSQKIIDKINSSSKYKSKVGEKLIFIIDKIDEINKASYIGKLFSYVLEGELKYDMFLRCSEVINKSFTPDLEFFLNHSFHSDSDCIERDGLLNAGILKVVNKDVSSFSLGNGFDDTTNELGFEISDIGYSILRHLKQKD